MSYPKLITDVPAKQDEFPGKAHDRIANSLVKILEGEDFRAEAIGLEGGWGSGKSTVLELVKEKTSNETSIFTFDAWQNHGDDFKRAFLETFLAWLSGEKFLKKSEAEEFLGEIRAHKSITTTKYRPKLSLLGILITLILPLFPIVYLWLGPLGFGANIQSEWEIGGHTFLAKNIALLIALLVLFLPYLLVMFFGFFRKGDFGSSVRMLVRQDEIDEQTQSIRNVDPTAVEFNIFLEKILNRMKKPEGRIIIVLDNIDRLPERDLEDAWGEMRNLVSLLARPHEVWAKMTIIVPYDPTHVFRNWERGSQTGESNISEGVLQKIFRTRLKVSPPIVSHWRKFLEDKLVQAFGPQGIEDAAQYKLSKLYEFHLRRSGGLPTPRDIIAFVNRVASTFMVWGDEISIEFIALYVVFSEELSRSTGALAKGTLLPYEVELLFDSERWQTYLSAIHFNVEINEADEVLLGRKVREAIEARDQAELEALQKHPAFYPILDEVLSENASQWANHNLDFFANSCASISSFEKNNPHFDVFIKTLSDAAIGLGDARSFDLGILKDFCQLIPHISEKRAIRLGRRLFDWLGHMSRNELGDDEGEDWLQGVEIITQALADNFGGVASIPGELRSIIIPGQSEFVVSAARGSLDCSDIDFSLMRSQVDKESITQTVANLISQKKQSKVVGIVKQLHSANDMLDSQYLLSKVIERVSQNKPTLDGSAMISMCALIDCLDDHWSSDSVQPILNDGSLLYWLANISAQQNELRATLFWRLKNKFEDAEPASREDHPAYGNTKSFLNEYNKICEGEDLNEDFVGAVARLAAKDHRFGFIFEQARNTGDSGNWAKQTLRELVRTSSFSRLVVKDIFVYFDELQNILGDDLIAVFVNYFSEWSPRFEKALEGEGIYECSPQIISIGLNSQDSGLKTIGKIVKQRLSEVPEENWEKALSENNRDIKLLLLTLRESSIELSVSKYRTPLLRHILGIASGMDLTHDQADWSLLFEAVPKGSRPKLAADVLKGLKDISVSKAAVGNLVRTFPNILQILPFEESPKVAVEGILLPAIELSELDVLELLQSRMNAFKASYEKSPKNTRAALSDSFRSAYVGADKTTRPVLKNWSDEIGIPIGSDDKEIGED